MGAIANPAEWHNLKEAFSEGKKAASGKRSGTGIYKWMKFIKPIWGATGGAEFNRQKGLIGGGYEALKEGNIGKAVAGTAALEPTTSTLPIKMRKKGKSSTSLIGG
jgi:hypothetical protein